MALVDSMVWVSLTVVFSRMSWAVDGKQISRPTNNDVLIKLYFFFSI